jgi:hypothetical protein
MCSATFLMCGCLGIWMKVEEFHNRT